MNIAIYIDYLINSISSHLAEGHRLYPLKPGTKHPLDTGWREKTYTESDLKKTLKSGRAVGLGRILGPLDLVIDVDKKIPKKYVDALKNSINLDTYTIDTSNNGYHYYYKLSKPGKYRTSLQNFGEIEFKTFGQTITLPYSIHPATRAPYLPSPIGDDMIALAPPWLEQQLLRQPKASPPAPRRTISAQDLKYLLDQLPVTDFGSNDTWLPILMASHHATYGSTEALDVFLDWSSGDPKYCSEDQINMVRLRWHSLDPNKIDGIDLRFLEKQILMRDGDLLSGERSANPSKIIQLAERCTPESTPSEIEQCLKYALDSDPVTLGKTRKILMDNLNVRASDIDACIHSIRKKTKAIEKKIATESRGPMASIPLSLADIVIQEKFNGNLIHATSQQFYHYDGTHWRPLRDNLLTRYIVEQAPSLYSHFENLEPNLIKYIEPTKTAMIGRCAVDKDHFGWDEDPNPVINCSNGELWLDQQSPNASLRPHSPDSFLLNCLPIEYDPSAECPRFEQALLEIFENSINPPGMVRHLWEIIGYIIQPRKNIPAYFIFLGDGSNGKTFVSQIITQLVGASNVLPKSIAEFLSNNAHVLSSLPGKLLVLDDDFEVSAKLPAGMIKKLAENKDFEANPKYKEPYNFRSIASPLILVNFWPRFMDLSYGFLRRAQILPFSRKFSPEEEDVNLAKKITGTELPGILNQAISGYYRLRERAKFDPPIDCLAAKKEWIELANPVMRYLNTRTTPSQNGSKVGLEALYNDYRVWCSMTGLRNPMAKPTFESSLQQFGCRIDKENIFGLSMNSEEY